MLAKAPGMAVLVRQGHEALALARHEQASGRLVPRLGLDRAPLGALRGQARSILWL
jgi:hypothetical protein